MTIDPIVVREHRDVLAKKSADTAKGIKAADALLWGCDYVKGQPALAVLKLDVGVIASSTPNADIVARYVKESAHSFAEDILDRAFQMAKDDFDAAKRATAQKQ